MRTLTMEEEKRLEVIQIVFRGELTVVEAAMMIGVSSRHVMAACSPLTKGAIERLSQQSGISILSCRSSRIALLCLSKRAVTNAQLFVSKDLQAKSPGRPYRQNPVYFRHP